MQKPTIYEIGIILTLISTFAIVGLSDKEPTHYCEDREIKAYCYDLSSTAKTCYTLPNTQGGKRCSSLWKEIPFIAESVPPIYLNSKQKCFNCTTDQGCIEC